MFYRVPDTNPGGIPTLFYDTFWDEREGIRNTGVGVVPGTLRPYFGEIPTGEFREWNVPDTRFSVGLDYDKFQRGEYPGEDFCWDFTYPVEGETFLEASASVTASGTVERPLGSTLNVNASVNATGRVLRASHAALLADSFINGLPAVDWAGSAVLSAMSTLESEASYMLFGEGTFVVSCSVEASGTVVEGEGGGGDVEGEGHLLVGGADTPPDFSTGSLLLGGSHS